jgi:hypothetical protein
VYCGIQRQQRHIGATIVQRNQVRNSFPSYLSLCCTAVGSRRCDQFQWSTKCMARRVSTISSLVSVKAFFRSHGIKRCNRLLSVFINSMYSFWWDVTNDWGLDLLRPTTWSPPLSGLSPNNSMSAPRSLVLPTLRANGKSMASSSAASIDLASPQPSNYGHWSNHFGLRRRLLFGDALIYYLAILFNFILRFTWSLKLSSHLHNVADMESGIFVMEALEVLRRWVWVFFRVEWEVLRKQEFVTPNGYRMGGNPEEFEFLLRGETSDSSS